MVSYGCVSNKSNCCYYVLRPFGFAQDRVAGCVSKEQAIRSMQHDVLKCSDSGETHPYHIDRLVIGG